MTDVKKGNLFKVPFTSMDLQEGLNIRQDYGDIKELAASIRVNGVKYPMRGFRNPEDPERFIVVDGHRRYKAMELLHDEGVEISAPFVLESQKYSEEQRIIDMVIAADGKALTPLELAEAVRRLTAYEYTDKEIAEKFSKSISYIGKLKMLSNAPKKLHKLIESNKVAATLAMEMMSKNQLDELLTKAENGELEQAKLFVQDGGKKGKKITKKNLEAGINSWSEFKKWAKDADKKDMSPEGKRLFEYLKRIADNKVTPLSFAQFFRN